MTRSPQELAQDVRDSTDGLIDASHVGEPWQVSAGQRAYDEALAELVALAEAGERARGPFTVNLRCEDGGSLKWSHMYANADGEIELRVHWQTVTRMICTDCARDVMDGDA